MTYRLKNLFISVASVGLSSNSERAQNDRIRLTNLYALFVSLVCGLIGSVLIHYQYSTMGVLAFVEAGIFCLCLPANYFKKNDLARFILLLNGYCTIYVFSTGLGRNSATHFWFLTGAILPFVLFEMRQRLYLVGCASISFLCMVFVWMSEFQYPLVEAVKLNPAAVQIISLLMIVLSFVTSLSAVIYQFLQYERSSHEVQSYLQSQIQNSEIRFKSVFEQAAAGIAFASLEGQIIDCNEMYSSIYGVTKSQLIGKNLREIFSYDKDEINKQAVQNLFANKSKFIVIERKVTRSDGTIVWCLVNASRIADQSGKDIYIAAFLQDITQQKNLQDKIVYTSSMASLGEMSAGLAHEINTPLAIISGRAWLMLERIKINNSVAPELVTDVEKVIATTDRIAKIVKGLLSFSRGNADEVSDYADLSNLVDNVRGLCEQRFILGQVKLIVDPVPQELVLCRMSQIEQVLLNLLNNAYDAVAELSDKWVQLSISASSERLIFKVTDSGLGIPENVIKKMMQPFFTTKAIGKGTGLGLSISKGIIENNGGTLEIDASSKNTCFVISVPTQLKSSKAVA